MYVSSDQIYSVSASNSTQALLTVPHIQISETNTKASMCDTNARAREWPLIRIVQFGRVMEMSHGLLS